MKTKLIAGAAGTSLLLAGLTVTAPPAAAAAPPKITIAISGDQATITQSQMRPGIVEFTIGETFNVPGPDGGPEPLGIMRTDQFDDVMSQFADVFGDPSDPTAGAKAAAAMRTIRENATFYGGGLKGTTYQVRLPAGNYYLLGVQSAAMGLTKPAPFTVSGQPRTGQLHATTGKIRAESVKGGGNKWVTAGLRTMGNGWLKFTNASKELHFLDMLGVTPKTTLAQVGKAFQSDTPPKFFTGNDYTFEVVSPGVSMAIKGPIASGRYLLTCFVPSEADGTPHAFMGMLKLVTVD